MRDSQMVWADSKEDLLKEIPGCSPLSFTFLVQMSTIIQY